MTQSDICLEKPIHVFLLRRTTVWIGQWKNIREEVLGIGRVFHNPITAVEPISDDTATLSWDGEIHCEQPIEYSSFTTSVVEVRVSLVYTRISEPWQFEHLAYQDFLVLSLLAPPGPLKSIPPQLYQTFPIRLVTHPWIDRS